MYQEDSGVEIGPRTSRIRLGEGKVQWNNWLMTTKGVKETREQGALSLESGHPEGRVARVPQIGLP